MPIKATDLERLPHQQLAREALKMKRRAAREKNKADNFWEALGSYGVGGGAAYVGGRMQGKAEAQWKRMVEKYKVDEQVTEEEAEKALASQDPRTFMGVQKDLGLGIVLGVAGLAVKQKRFNRAAQWAGHGLVAGALHQMGVEAGFDEAMASEQSEEEEAA